MSKRTNKGAKMSCGDGASCDARDKRSARRRPGRLATSTAAISAIGVIAVAGGAAEASHPAKVASHAATTTITWSASPITTSGPDPRTVLINDFQKANPTIKVKLISAPTNTDTNESGLETQISGGSTSPDVFMGDVVWPAVFGAHQLAYPLSKSLPSSFFSTFASGLVAGATYKGSVYGAPFFEDQGFLYYRKDLLKKEGLSVPTTWEQVMADSEKLQKAKLIQYGFVWQGADYEGATCNFMEYLTDAGGKVLNSSGTKSALNSPSAVKALSFMRSLVTSGVTPAAVSTYQEPQAMNAFDNGQAAFLRNWDYAYSTSQSSGSKVIGEVGVAPMPTFQGQATPGYSNIGGWNLYINPHSKHLQQDLTFIKYMTGTAAQTALATQFSEIPTNQSVRSSAKVIAVNPVLATVPKTKLVARPAQTPQYPKVSQAIYQNVNEAISGSKSPSAAISAASSAINTALSGSGL
ncbi:MAG: transporter substrate-binding protein [Acidimicrobiaceae bacterium]|jgi:multiple sugar transport system substrate-binding protein|nr:transporter substrate-binding protein [Acidimicrobiaceae bacterium]